MTFARRRPRTIPELQRTLSHDRGPPTLHSTAAPAALADGALHPGHAVHRRRHVVYGQTEIPDAGFASQTAWDSNSGAGTGPLGGAPDGAPVLPADLPETMKLAAKLSHY